MSETAPPSKSPGRIAGMFSAIAPRYDLLNTLLSLGFDRSWRMRTAGALRARGPFRLFDACAGTGELALAFRRVHGPDARLVAGDFSEGMLRVARRKRLLAAAVALTAADTLRLPFPAGVFDACAVGFGIRNVADLDRGLAELARVLRPGGAVFVLEFTPSSNLFWRTLFHLYFTRLLPLLGNLLSGAGRVGAYSYLPKSVLGFAGEAELKRRMERAGFRRISAQPMTFGIVTLFVGQRG
jgi:demethylmenaquinone methyltransferase/2-methoxy-6-polyprenyl-1,4-benzoquinol methylase